MIEKILEMLQISDFMGESEAIDIAKGKYKTQDTFQGIKKQIKRAKSWQ